MITHEVKANNRRACFQIKTRRGEFSFPFTKLRLAPSSTNRITDVYVDREAGKQALTYVLQSGDEVRAYKSKDGTPRNDISQHDSV